MSDVLDFKRYATHMQQVCNKEYDMYRTFSEKSGNVLFCAFLQAVQQTMKLERKAEIAEMVYYMSCGSGGNESLREILIDVMHENEQ